MVSIPYSRIRYMLSTQGHSGRVPIHPKLHSNVQIPYGWTDDINHVGFSTGPHVIFRRSPCRRSNQSSTRQANMFLYGRGPCEFSLLTLRYEVTQPRNISYEFQLGTAAQRSSLVRSKACGAKKEWVFWQTITDQTFRIFAGRLLGKSALVDTKAESLYTNSET